MVDESIIASIRKYISAITEEGLNISFAVLFGSYANGTATADSDIDLLVVSPQFDNMKDRSFINQLWRTAARTDNRIEPIPCGEIKWLEDDSSAIVEIARRSGVKIAANNQ